MKPLDGSRGPNTSATREVGLGSLGGGMHGANDRLLALQNGANNTNGEEYFVPH